MESERQQAERQQDRAAGRPARYKLYDRLKDRVSLRTVDTVIAVTAVLIVIALVYGIMTANPPQ